MFRRTAWPLYRWTRPSRCSRSTGLAGRFQWTTAWHHRWKSRPSWPTDVDVSTNGQNGELNAVDTDSTRASPPLSRVWLPKATANRVRIRCSSSVTSLPVAPARGRRRGTTRSATSSASAMRRRDVVGRFDASVVVVEVEVAEPVAQDVGVLVEDRLQVAVDRSAERRRASSGRCASSVSGAAADPTTSR